MEQIESVKEQCENFTEKVSMDNTEGKKPTVGESCHKLYVAEEQQPDGKLCEVPDKMYMCESSNADNVSSNNSSIAEEMRSCEKSLRVFEENNKDSIQQTVQDLTSCLEQKKNLELLINSDEQHSLEETKSIDTSNGRNSDGVSAVETPTLCAKVREHVSVIQETLEISGSSENLQNGNLTAGSTCTESINSHTSTLLPVRDASRKQDEEGVECSADNSQDGAKDTKPNEIFENTNDLKPEQKPEDTRDVKSTQNSMSSDDREPEPKCIEESDSSFYPDDVPVTFQTSHEFNPAYEFTPAESINPTNVNYPAGKFVFSDYPWGGESTTGVDTSSFLNSSITKEQLHVATASNQTHDLQSGACPNSGSSLADDAEADDELQEFLMSYRKQMVNCRKQMNCWKYMMSYRRQIMNYR